MLNRRTTRIAANEARFRDINERLEADLLRLPLDGEPAEFVCECGDVDCADVVPLTLDEYERVREDPLLFALVPGHELAEAEDVLVRERRYVVVRKKAEAAPIVENDDPRGQGPVDGERRG